MTPSIRTFLLINLLLSITLITSLAIIGNLFLEHKDLQKHLNAQLTFAALTIQSFVSEGFDADRIPDIQDKIDAFPGVISEYYRKTHQKDLTPADELIQFQIWSSDHRLLLKSRGAPSEPLSNNISGFSTNWVENQLWHVFSNTDPDSNLRVDVGERSDFREELEGRVTQDSIFIMLLTYPFLGLLIWFIVGRGLDSIRQVADEVRQREPSYLESVNLENVPTEIQPLVDELNTLFSRLKDAFEREKRFASDAAHELRTPLAALRAQTQVALKIKDTEKLHEAFKKILMSVDRSTHVVQQLLTMSRMVPQATIKHFELVDLVKVCKEVISDVVPEALKKNSEIALEVQTQDYTFNGIPTTIGILLRNLLDNAVRYTPENSKIDVSVTSDKDAIILVVADNGPGIPEHLRDRVFERFYRILGSNATGSGLGLGIVEQIVELHRATISLSKPQEHTGLIVTIKFPR